MKDIIEKDCNEKVNEKNRNLKVQENIEVQQKTGRDWKDGEGRKNDSWNM